MTPEQRYELRAIRSGESSSPLMALAFLAILFFLIGGPLLGWYTYKTFFIVCGCVIVIGPFIACTFQFLLERDLFNRCHHTYDDNCDTCGGGAYLDGFGAPPSGVPHWMRLHGYHCRHETDEPFDYRMAHYDREAVRRALS